MEHCCFASKWILSRAASDKTSLIWTEWFKKFIKSMNLWGRINLPTVEVAGRKTGPVFGSKKNFHWVVVREGGRRKNVNVRWLRRWEEYGVGKRTVAVVAVDVVVDVVVNDVAVIKIILVNLNYLSFAECSNCKNLMSRPISPNIMISCLLL